MTRRAEGFPNTAGYKDYVSSCIGGMRSGATKRITINQFKDVGLASPYSQIGKCQVRIIRTLALEKFDELVECGLLYAPIPSVRFPGLGTPFTEVKYTSLPKIAEIYCYLIDMGYIEPFEVK